MSANIIATTAAAMLAFFGVLVPGALVVMGVAGYRDNFGLVLPAVPILVGLLLHWAIGIGMHGLAAGTVRDGLHPCVPILGAAVILGIAGVGVARAGMPDKLYWILPCVLACSLVVIAYCAGKSGMRDRLGVPQRGIGRLCAQCGYDVASLGEHVPCPECGGVMRVAAPVPPAPPGAQ